MDNQYLLIVEISKEDGITIIYNNLIINFEISASAVFKQLFEVSWAHH